MTCELFFGRAADRSYGRDFSASTGLRCGDLSSSIKPASSAVAPEEIRTGFSGCHMSSFALGLIESQKSGRTIVYRLVMSVLEDALLGFAQTFGYPNNASNSGIVTTATTNRHRSIFASNDIIGIEIARRSEEQRRQRPNPQALAEEYKCGDRIWSGPAARAG